MMDTPNSNKIVVANWGPANQGKTKTVKEIAKIILAKPGALCDPSSPDFSKDIQLVVTIKNIKIGIESQGDPDSRLFESLEKFLAEKCQIIICSTRSSGATVKAVEKLHSLHNYDNVWVTNHRSNEKDQDKLNKVSAEQIVHMLKQFSLLP